MLSKACIPAGGPRDDFTAFVEWMLVVNNDSPFTIGLAEDHTSPTLLPETGHPPLTTSTVEIREHTADRGLQPATIGEAETEDRTEGVVAPEPDPQVYLTRCVSLLQCVLPREC